MKKFRTSLKLLTVATGLLLISSIVFLVYISQNSTKSSEQLVKSETSEEMEVVELTATNFSFSKEEIIVDRGEKIAIRADNQEGRHGITIPELRVFSYGGDVVEFTPEEEGEYNFFCANPHYGSGHNLMKGKLIVR
jgi:cytochrome c oxidase subunit 2